MEARHCRMPGITPGGRRMNMKNKKRLLSWMLVLVMLVSLMPTAAFAAEGIHQTEVTIESNVPPESVRIGPSQRMNVWRPPISRTS